MKFSLFLGCALLFPRISEAQDQAVKAPVNVLIIIADDMSKTAGIYGDKTISTPAIDAVAKDGVVFDHAYCTASSCSPSRASILTSRYPHQLKEGGNLWGTLPVSYATYTRLLAENNYQVGSAGKGWGPGDFAPGGYKENPAGAEYKDFEQFLSKLPAQKPFCFWVGSHDPHRPYAPDLKKTAGLNADALKVPVWIPDAPVVREDLLDYYAEVKRFDQTVQETIDLLKKNGLYDQTLIIITSDNGMPFPRVKANAYDASTNIPLVMRWGKNFNHSSHFDQFVSLIDLAPTVLEAAGIPVPESMTGKTLLPLLLKGESDPRFEEVFTERERHANVRENHLGYPIRAIRTKDYIYIQNLRADRWPAGDPLASGSPEGFGDIDDGPAKKFLVDHKDDPKFKMESFWSLSKRPAEELYDLKKDPYQLKNTAGDPAYAKIKKELGNKLSEWRRQTEDPLLNNTNDIFDTYPSYGGKKLKK